MTTLTQEQMTPWEPINDRLKLKILGKQLEELNELGSATARCIIQGIDEKEPVTGKENRLWLSEEIADVLATVLLTVEHFNLDKDFIARRSAVKQARLISWHEM